MDLKKPTIIFAAIFSFLVFWGGAQIFKTKSVSPYASDSLFTYIMPRISRYIPKFSLFDRTFVDDIDPKKLAPKSATTAQATDNLTKPNAAAPVAAKPAVKPNQQNNMNNPANTLGLPVVGQTPTNKDPENPNSDSNNPNVEGGGGVAGKPFSPEKPNTENQVNDWKTKILSNPTREVMSEFVREFESEKITREVFYQVMDELVKERIPEIQELTLFGLAELSSYDALSFLLKHREDYNAQASTMYHKVLAMYEKPDKLKLLSMALNSGDTRVVLGVMPIISKVGSKLAEWSSDMSSHSDDRRDDRGPANRLPKGDLIPLIKALQNLTDSKDHQIATEARETLNDINYNPLPPTQSPQENNTTASRFEQNDSNFR